MTQFLVFRVANVGETVMRDNLMCLLNEMTFFFFLIKKKKTNTTQMPKTDCF